MIKGLFFTSFQPLNLRQQEVNCRSIKQTAVTGSCADPSWGLKVSRKSLLTETTGISGSIQYVHIVASFNLKSMSAILKMRFYMSRPKTGFKQQVHLINTPIKKLSSQKQLSSTGGLPSLLWSHWTGSCLTILYSMLTIFVTKGYTLQQNFTLTG